MTVPVDVYASEPHFLDHLAAVWLSLPAELRGRFMAPRLVDRAVRRGIAGALDATPGAVDGPGRPMLVAAYGDLKRARKAGRTRLALFQHGMGQSYGAAIGRSADAPSYPGGRDNDDVGLFLCPNAHSAGRWRAAYPSARVEIVGSPRLDVLPRRRCELCLMGEGPHAGHPAVVAFGFHWDCRIASETRSGFWEYRPAVLAARRELGLVLGHGHPRLLTHAAGFPRRWYERNRVPVVDDFTDVLEQADVYVFDNSSSGYEFASTGRPVVVLDSYHYRPGVDHGLRFYEAADVGIRVRRPVDVTDAIAEALADPPARRAAREAALGIVYAHRSGAARRAVGVIADWLTARRRGLTAVRSVA